MRRRRQQQQRAEKSEQARDGATVDYVNEFAGKLPMDVISELMGVPPGDRDQVRSIWAGECDISLGNTYYMGQMLEDPEQAEWTEAVRIEFPVFEETGGTHVNVSGGGVAKNAPNRATIKIYATLGEVTVD